MGETPAAEASNGEYADEAALEPRPANLGRHRGVVRGEIDLGLVRAVAFCLAIASSAVSDPPSVNFKLKPIAFAASVGSLWSYSSIG